MAFVGRHNGGVEVLGERSSGESQGGGGQDLVLWAGPQGGCIE